MRFTGGYDGSGRGRRWSGRTIVVVGLVGLAMIASVLTVCAPTAPGTFVSDSSALGAGLPFSTVGLLYSSPAATDVAGSLQFVVPVGWPAPQSLVATGAGYVRAASSSCTSASVTSVAGSGPWTVTARVSCPAGTSVRFTYGAYAPGDLGPSTPATYTFAAALKVDGAGSYVAFQSSPTVTVVPAPSAITVTTNPQTVVADGTSAAQAIVTLTGTDGQPLPGQASFIRLEVDGPSVPGPLVDNGDGTYTAAIPATTAVGDRTVRATSWSVSSTTVLHQVVGPAAALAIGTTPALLYADGHTPVTTYLIVKDAQGHPTVGANVSFTLDGVGLTPVVDHGNGTYTATFTTSTVLGSRTLVATTGSLNATQALTQVAPGLDTRSAGVMSTPRVGHVAALLHDGRVLVAGGYDGASVLRSAEIYDPATGTWAATTAMRFARRNAISSVLPDGRVLVAGGSNGSSPTASAEIYDPTARTWSTAKPMGTAWSEATATDLVAGRVLVAGGTDGSVDLATAETYDPASGKWKATAPMVASRRGHAATILADGRALVVGGNPTSLGERFDPTTNGWAAITSTTGTYGGFYPGPSATLLTSGKVLLIELPPQTGALYDPTVDQFSLSWEVQMSRGHHTATRLADGRVLFAGGGSADLDRWVEIYDPATGHSAVVAFALSARRDHTATLLPDGSVLLVGGTGSTGVLASAERDSLVR